MKCLLKKILLIATLIVSCHQNLNAAATTTGVVAAVPEIDIMDMPGVFHRVNMTKVPDFCAGLAVIPELAAAPVRRFFDLLSFQQAKTREFCTTLSQVNELGSLPAKMFVRLIPTDDLSELMKNQLVYHLAMLIALGPTITRDLIAGKYAWVLDSDQSTSDRPVADLLYHFFAKAENTTTRQQIWNVMRSSGLIESAITDVQDSFYNCGMALKFLLETSSEPLDIVIGGNSIPTYYKAVDPKCSGDYKHPATNAFGSSGYCHSYQQGCITVGVDHRHRPRVLANAYNEALWADIPWEKVKQIKCDYLNMDQLRAVVPAAMHGKLVELDNYE